VTKSGDDNDRRPFGSAFWHNGSRSTWYVHPIEQSADDNTLRLGFFNRKANLGKLHSPVSYLVTFGDEQTEFRRVDIADNSELASKLSVQQRMYHALRRGSMEVEEIASAIEAKPETVERTARRYPRRFIVLTGGRIGLKEVSA